MAAFYFISDMTLVFVAAETNVISIFGAFCFSTR